MLVCITPVGPSLWCRGDLHHSPRNQRDACVGRVDSGRVISLAPRWVAALAHRAPALDVHHHPAPLRVVQKQQTWDTQLAAAAAGVAGVDSVAASRLVGCRIGAERGNPR